MESKYIPPRALASLGAEDLRKLTRRRLRATTPAEHGDYRLNPGFRDWVVQRAVTPAAVLVPLIERRDGLNFLLTRRTDTLTRHSGQVAFPGGKVDLDDRSVEEAALREAHEEIRLEPSFVEIIGRLPDYLTGSGYRISPVVALVDSSARFEANPHEVAGIFEVPLSFLMDPANHHVASRYFEGRDRHYFEMPYGEHHIWGVTAGILHMMHERLFA
jgi:8-oxo-dGTP pyrophosphatase MutT (NUDIX family)